jgi:putative exosortase-associated protein (TIGR04073 family)
MKKIVCVLFVIMFMLAASTSFAQNDDYAKATGDKAYWGFVNVLTGWIEIPAQVAKGYEYGWMGKDNTGWVGAIGGFAAGVGSAVGRTLSGAGELAGCWAADPATNDGIGIPLDAEFAWEQGTVYDMTDPSFRDATTRPVLQKLQRGAFNVLFGVCEVPGQIMKGIEEKAWDAGIIKGIWYFLSREIDGAVDLMTFFLPGPRDVRGVAFDEKWAWSAMGEKSNIEESTTDTAAATSSSIK